MVKMTIESQALEALKELVGPKVVLTDADEIANHSYDFWPVAFKWRQQGKQPYQPDAVCRVTHAGQVSKIMAWATENGVPVTPWGLGSSVTGAPLPTEGGIVIDMFEMRKVLALDETDLLVKVQAGKLGIELERELNEKGYTLHHSPQSLDRSSVGGWVSTRATGQFSSRWGGIEHLAVAFSVVLPTGELVETHFIPRAAVGPDLRHVFMGAEGTMGVITDVTLKIFPLPEHRIFEALTYDSVEAGLETMREFMALGLRPFLVRFYDVDEAKHAMQDRDFDKCAMFLGFEGIPAVAEAEYAATLDICKAHGGEPIGPEAVEAWMDRRFDFSTVENLLEEPGGLAETIEVAHFWSGIGEVYHALKEALRPYAAEVLGHFSHVYPQGSSLYVILLGHAADDATAEEAILKIWQVAMDICIEKGATISHHHGVGLARAGYVHKDLDTAFVVLEKLKHAIDPANIMNPGKLDLEP
jgi:alkyldihydroxyacetonephosphate synthase